MLTVKTKIGPSKIDGIGLFADESINKGTVVWKLNPLIDVLLTKEQIATLSVSSQEQFYKYAYLDKTYGKYLLCGDDGRFFNHSTEPNCDETMPDQTTALRKIMKGEELTVNYAEFYGDVENHPEVKF
jgi:hypothetical protein